MSDRGLKIGGEQIEFNAAQFLSVLKYVVVPESAWSKPAFKSGDIDQVSALADPMAMEIVMAMMDDYLLHSFDAPPDLANNIALRIGVMDAMRAITSGAVDADYAEAIDGVPPTIGYLKNLEVLGEPDARYGKAVLPGDLPFSPPDASWLKVPTRSPWTGQAFFQKPETKLSEALADITPFRGECAGALQLSVLLGCLNGLGAEAVDALEPAFGLASLGVWRMPQLESGKPIMTAASRFLTQLHDVPADYERGAVLAVPGDYIYFANKDDYPTLAPTGGWRGENCIYMGTDALGNPHYSGMGLTWKTEFALRMFLCNAYFTDCNAQYLEDRRNGATPSQPPVIVEDRQTQVRFVARAVMRYPDTTGEKAPYLAAPILGPDLSSADIDLRLSQTGRRTPNGKGYIIEDMAFGDLLNIFLIPQSALLPPGKVPNGNPELVASLEGWQFAFTPRVQGIDHLTLEDRVDLQASRISEPV